MEVKLLKSHTHAGVEYGEGHHLTLDEDTAKRVIGWGVAEEVKPLAAESKPKKPFSLEAEL